MKLPKIIRQHFAKQSEEQHFFTGFTPPPARDRYLPNFREIIEDSLNSWRSDPLARRIVNLTTEYAIGRGIQVSADEPEADAFLQAFWNHPLNRMDQRVREWSDELCRSGNLFIMLSSDGAGMSYVRAIPASQVEEIVPRVNDIEQPLSFRLREGLNQMDEVSIPAADLMRPTAADAMLHFPVNRAIGAQWGEPDLAPLLVWLHRYTQWLEDRARQNHYRNCFVYIVKSQRMNENARVQRQSALNRYPPSPGSILVTGADEEWTVLSPQLESADANEDGLALKKMIAAGAGLPLQYFAEPGTMTKADSEGVEGSLCRGLEHRQQFLLCLVETLLRHVLARRGFVNVNVRVTGDEVDQPDEPEVSTVRENPA